MAENSGRPLVTVEASTATTCEIHIKTEKGTIRILAGHEDISIDANGVKVEVQP